jgi:hypothetical protein
MSVEEIREKFNTPLLCLELEMAQTYFAGFYPRIMFMIPWQPQRSSKMVDAHINKTES